jgi:hypothetical protein
MPLAPGNSVDDLKMPGPKRDLQYREANLFIVRHCHVLIALWDGIEEDPSVGGTAETVAYKRKGIPLRISGSARASIDGIEIGPVIHIRTPRVKAQPPRDNIGIHPYNIGIHPWGKRAKGAPWGGVIGQGLRGLGKFLAHLFGFTPPKSLAKLTEDEVRARDAWSDFDALITLTRRFNEEKAGLESTADGARRIGKSLSELFEGSADTTSSFDARDRVLARLPRRCDAYAASDTLAGQWQGQFWVDWRILFGLGFLALSCFEIAAHILPGHDYLLLVYSLSIVCIFGFLLRARTNQHQERFLDYRALAEAMRVAIFWRLAGIGEKIDNAPTSAPRQGIAADAYPIGQPSELAWVKTVLQSLELLDTIDGPVERISGLDSDTHNWIRGAWVDGQRHYFDQKRESYSLKAEGSEARSLVLLLLSPLIAVAIFAQHIGLIHYELPHWINIELHELLIFVTGMLPGVAAVTVGLSQQLALRAQARQYDRMLALFERAYELLPETLDPACAPLVRDLYFQLGIEAMSENAEWVSIYRQRPLRPTQA